MQIIISPLYASSYLRTSIFENMNYAAFPVAKDKIIRNPCFELFDVPEIERYTVTGLNHWG
jgi:hypothetical protein